MEELRRTIKSDRENMIQRSSRFKIASAAVGNIGMYMLTYARMITSCFKLPPFNSAIPSSPAGIQFHLSHRQGSCFLLKHWKLKGTVQCPELADYYIGRYPGLLLGGLLNPKVLCFDATQALGESLPDLGTLFSLFMSCEACELIYLTCSRSGTQLTLLFLPHQKFTNISSLSLSSLIIPFLSAFPFPPLLLCLILISSSQSTLALQEGGRAPDSDSFSLSAS